MKIVTNLAFEKIKQIGVGQGLNSTVWLVKDQQLNCELAVKEIDKTTFWNPNCFAEAQTVYAAAHPNVVGVQYGCEQGNSAYIAMPFYPQGSLSDLLAAGPLKLSATFSLAQDVLLGLQHIHAVGFLHLDIKPSNIFFDHLKRALIADFGQSRQIGPGGIVSGPSMYFVTMPPEVLLSGCAASVSDIFQVGALIYRAVNGEQIWQEQLSTFPTDAALEDAIKAGQFPDRTAFLPHVPKRLRTTLRKSLSVDPMDRYSSATDFAAALGKVKVSRDWSVTLLPAGEMEWRCTSKGASALLVQLKRDGSGWKTRVLTVTAGVERAKGKKLFWEALATRRAALAKLKMIFEAL